MISYPGYHSIDLEWDLFPFLTLTPLVPALPLVLPSLSPSPPENFLTGMQSFAGKVLDIA